MTEKYNSSSVIFTSRCSFAKRLLFPFKCLTALIAAASLRFSYSPEVTDLDSNLIIRSMYLSIIMYPFDYSNSYFFFSFFFSLVLEFPESFVLTLWALFPGQSVFSLRFRLSGAASSRNNTSTHLHVSMEIMKLRNVFWVLPERSGNETQTAFLSLDRGDTEKVSGLQRSNFLLILAV